MLLSLAEFNMSRSYTGRPSSKHATLIKVRIEPTSSVGQDATFTDWFVNFKNSSNKRGLYSNSFLNASNITSGTEIFECVCYILLQIYNAITILSLICGIPSKVNFSQLTFLVLQNSISLDFAGTKPLSIVVCLVSPCFKFFTDFFF